MGMFSWKCKGCGHELIAGELVRLDGSVQTYDGYGGSNEDGEPSGWHDRCYRKTSDFERLSETPSLHAPNQGFGPAKLEFLSNYHENAATTYTVLVACGWYSEGDCEEFEFHLTNSGMLEDQKEYQVRYDEAGDAVSLTSEELDEYRNLPKAERQAEYAAHQKKVEELVGSAMPARNARAFASIDEAIAAVEPLLDHLPEKCEGQYELQIRGKQREASGVVYHRTVSERWDRTGYVKDWVKMNELDIETYRIGSERGGNRADKLKQAEGMVAKAQLDLVRAREALRCATEGIGGA